MTAGMRARRGALAGLAVIAAALGTASPAAALDFRGGAGFFVNPLAGAPSADPKSAEWVAGLRAANAYPYLNGPTNLFAPPVYEVDASTPMVEVRCRFCGAFTGEGETKYEDRIRVPIPPGAEPDPSADGHIAFVDRARRLEWNLINARPNGDGTWSAGGAGQFDLDGDGSQNVVLGGGSATASHLPLSQAVSPAEVSTAIADGSYLIPHALQWGAPNIDGRCWVYPALGSDGGVRGGLPEGARIQLDPNLDLSGLTPGARVIARTLQVHGAYLRDLSGAFVVYLRATRGSETPWSALGIDGDSLKAIPTESFRVLPVNYATKGTPNQPKVQRPATDCGPGADQVAPQARRLEGTAIGAADGGTTGTGGGSGTSTSSASSSGRRPLAPKNLRVRVRTINGIRKAQFVWNSRQSRTDVPRYRVYVDGRAVATVSKTFTAYIRIRRGARRVTVAGISRRGVVGVKTKAVRFRL